MDTFSQDIRYALRRIAKSPAFSALVVLTLALGIGANTAIFSVVNAVLLRPLPYPDAESLVSVFHHYPSLDLDASVSAGGFRDYRDRTRSFESVAVQSGWGANLTGGGEPVRVRGSRVSAQWFAVLDVPPAQGRAFTADEDVPGNHYVAVISDGLWHRQFGGDPDILGRVISMNGEPFTIIGVMPPAFRDFRNPDAEIWAPLALTETQFTGSRTSESLNLVARVGPGATVASATTEMTQFAEMLKQETPGQYPPDWTLKVVSFGELATGPIRPALLVLLGAVAFVLLIACANVANLLLARASGRLKEVAVRVALGARRWQLIRQLLAESTMLAVAGGAIGLLLAWTGLRALTVALDVPVLLGDSIGLDATVLTFTGLLAVFTGILFGLAPALQTTKADVQDTLREGGRGSAADRSGQLLRRAFVVAEFGLALTLLAGAGLLLKSFSRLQAVDPGFDAENVLTATVVLPATTYPDAASRISFFDRALTRIEATPGVMAAGATNVLPFGGNWATATFGIEGYQPPEGEPSPWGDMRRVSPGFAEAMGIPLLQGRFFDDRDVEGSLPVVVVDEELVRRYFADVDPIGRRLVFGDPDDPATPRPEIIGVVGHTAHEGLDAERRVQVYMTYRQRASAAMSLVVRTQGDPLRQLGSVRTAIQTVDPNQPLSNIASLSDRIGESVGQRRIAMLLLGVFAAIGLLLAATGIYGVMSYNVMQRSQEMGVRMALGAGRTQVLHIVMRQGLVLAGIGTALGLLGALGITRALQSQLFEVGAADPATFIAVTVMLFGIGTLATLVPALRATRLDPVEALRQE